MGKKVFIADQPKRIVALAANITEILFDLGLGESIVGVTRFSNYPPEAKSVPKVGSFVNLNIEKIVSLSPELIIGTADGNPKESVLRLKELGYPVYLIDPRTVPQILQSILHIGEITGRPQAARRRVYGMKTVLERTARLLRGRKRPRVFLQIGVRPLVTAGRNTFQDNLIRLAGGVNIAGELNAKYPKISMEEVLVKRPEVIVITSMRRGGDFRREKSEWMRWTGIPAVDMGRIHVVDSDIVDRPSPRIIMGLLEMVRIIHPELEADIEMLARSYPIGPIGGMDRKGSL